MIPPATADEDKAAPVTRPDLIFQWHHRPRTWGKLTFWLILVLAAHLAAFILFRVRMPVPARAMPVPATLVLATRPSVDPASSDSQSTLAGMLSPLETADLELPEHEPAEPHVPAFANHAIAREPWPARPEAAAWPEVSQVSKPVLPPASPAPPAPPSKTSAEPPQ